MLQCEENLMRERQKNKNKQQTNQQQQNIYRRKHFDHISKMDV